MGIGADSRELDSILGLGPRELGNAQNSEGASDDDDEDRAGEAAYQAFLRSFATDIEVGGINTNITVNQQDGQTTMLDGSEQRQQLETSNEMSNTPSRNRRRESSTSSTPQRGRRRSRAPREEKEEQQQQQLHKNGDEYEFDDDADEATTSVDESNNDDNDDDDDDDDDDDGEDDDDDADETAGAWLNAFTGSDDDDDTDYDPHDDDIDDDGDVVLRVSPHELELLMKEAFADLADETDPDQHNYSNSLPFGLPFGSNPSRQRNPDTLETDRATSSSIGPSQRQKNKRTDNTFDDDDTDDDSDYHCDTGNASGQHYNEPSLSDVNNHEDNDDDDIDIIDYPHAPAGGPAKPPHAFSSEQYTRLVRLWQRHMQLLTQSYLLSIVHQSRDNSGIKKPSNGTSNTSPGGKPMDVFETLLQDCKERVDVARGKQERSTHRKWLYRHVGPSLDYPRMSGRHFELRVTRAKLAAVRRSLRPSMFSDVGLPDVTAVLNNAKEIYEAAKSGVGERGVIGAAGITNGSLCVDGSNTNIMTNNAATARTSSNHVLTPGNQVRVLNGLTLNGTSVALVQLLAQLYQAFSPLLAALAPTFDPDFVSGLNFNNPIRNGRTMFSSQEEILMVLGMKHYTENDLESIRDALLPVFTVKQIRNRIKNRCTPKAPNNIIKLFRHSQRCKTFNCSPTEDARLQFGVAAFGNTRLENWVTISERLLPHRGPRFLSKRWRWLADKEKEEKKRKKMKKKKTIEKGTSKSKDTHHVISSAAALASTSTSASVSASISTSTSTVAAVPVNIPAPGGVVRNNTTVAGVQLPHLQQQQQQQQQCHPRYGHNVYHARRHERPPPSQMHQPRRQVRRTTQSQVPHAHPCFGVPATYIPTNNSSTNTAATIPPIDVPPVPTTPSSLTSTVDTAARVCVADLNSRNHTSGISNSISPTQPTVVSVGNVTAATDVRGNGSIGSVNSRSMAVNGLTFEREILESSDSEFDENGLGDEEEGTVSAICDGGMAVGASSRTSLGTRRVHAGSWLPSPRSPLPAPPAFGGSAATSTAVSTAAVSFEREVLASSDDDEEEEREEGKHDRSASVTF